jgi:hypothetical protein
MPSYIILDTSIYREMGLRFYENIDYQNLCKFTLAINSEVLLSGIVIEEFTHYYRTTLQKKIEDYKSITHGLARDPFFTFQETPSPIDNLVSKAVTAFQRKLKTDPNTRNSPIASIAHSIIDGIALTKFILESKQKDDHKAQVRDFLIWESILTMAREESSTRTYRIANRRVKMPKMTISFITKDKGFQENSLMQQRQKEYGVSNIQIYNSIPQFLYSKGYNIAFVTEHLILNKITDSKIMKDLSKDIGCLLTYVSAHFNAPEYSHQPVVSAEILNKEITEYYSYYDDDGQAKYVAHLKVSVRVVFAKDSLHIGYETPAARSYPAYLQTYDLHGQPFYEAPILFFYKGLLDAEKKTIRSVQFIDFLPNT